jgi:NADPH2:quinone reductase
MKALRFKTFGDPSVLSVEEIPTPQPGPGESVVRVTAAAINPSDLKNVSGHFKQTTLPRTPGRDFAGVVERGEQYQGQAVWGTVSGLGLTRDGTHAEYVVVPTAALSLKPASLSMDQAAATGVPFVTAFATLVRVAALAAGETILIVGARGAVGRAATQIANWKQARVLGADRNSDPLPGAVTVINTSTENLPERVRAITGGRGADAVLDCVGGKMFEPALNSLRRGGRQVAITSTGEKRVSFDLVDFYHNLSQLRGFDSLALSDGDVATILDELRTGFETGALKPSEIETTPLGNGVEAYKKAAGSGGRKQVLIMRDNV